MRIGTYTFDEFAEEVRRFHGSPAPGVIIGGFMVDAAKAGLPDGVLFEAICETRICLPDAVQLTTPCTLGNGRLRVAHVGRFALTLYDKISGEGVRAFIVTKKLDRWPTIKEWFLKLRPKAEQDTGKLIEEIREAGTDYIGTARVRVDPEYFGKKKIGPVRVCPGCGEAYPASDGERCGGCRGELPYE